MKFFGKFDLPYLITVYGDVSPEVLANAKAGVDVKVYSLLTGLEK